MRNAKKWYSYDVDSTTSKHLKIFLKKTNIQYEASENYDLIHFEIYANIFQDNCIKSFLLGFSCADDEFNKIPF